MEQRKKKLIIIQIVFFAIGLSIIMYTYIFKEKKNSEIISLENVKKIDEQFKKNQNLTEDVFFNIKYSGLDLAGNRYILLAKEATARKTNEELYFSN